MSLVVGPDPLVTANATHISIATHSVWGTFLACSDKPHGARNHLEKSDLRARKKHSK